MFGGLWIYSFSLYTENFNLQELIYGIAKHLGYGKVWVGFISHFREQSACSADRGLSGSLCGAEEFGLSY